MTGRSGQSAGRRAVFTSGHRLFHLAASKRAARRPQKRRPLAARARRVYTARCVAIVARLINEAIAARPAVIRRGAAPATRFRHPSRPAEGRGRARRRAVPGTAAGAGCTAGPESASRGLYRQLRAELLLLSVHTLTGPGTTQSEGVRRKPPDLIESHDSEARAVVPAPPTIDRAPLFHPPPRSYLARVRRGRSEWMT